MPNDAFNEGLMWMQKVFRTVNCRIIPILGKLTEDDGKYVEEIRLEGEKKLKIQAIINREIVDETSNHDEIDVVDEEEVEGIFFFEQFDEDD